MVGRMQFAGLALLICALLFSGCRPSDRSGEIAGAQLGEVDKTPAEKDRAKLLRTIDRRWENPEAHFELGRLYQADGLWAKAEYHYNIVLGFDPVHRPAQAARVKVLLDSGDTEQAGVSTDFYINQASSSALGSLKLALAFQKQALDEYALVCYRRALRLAPNSAKVHRQIGYYYLSRGNKEQAVDYLSRSFQLDANQPEVAYELGRLGVVARRPRKIEKDTRKLDKAVERSDKEISP